MGFLGNIFEQKYCAACGQPVDLLKGTKIIDGYICNRCKSMLSPFHVKIKKSCVKNIIEEINDRRKNIDKHKTFNYSKKFGDNDFIFIDEENSQFLISKTENFQINYPDIIEFNKIQNCIIDISSSSKEIKYKDSNDEIRSFSPPTYAYSYDFYIVINVSIPYISQIRLKLNNQPIDNHQPTLIDMKQSGVLNQLFDRLYTGKTFNNGKTSNEDEVRSSLDYQKYDFISKEILNILTKQSYVKKKVICPWCGCKISSDMIICNHCGGVQ